MKSDDERFYDDPASFKQEEIGPFAAKTSLYYARYERLFGAHFNGRSDLKVMELGAGSCCLSLLVSNMSTVSEIYCCDISVERMRRLAPMSSQHLACRKEKLRFLHGDLNARFELPDGHFDAVLFDGALHHSRSIWNTLSECRRILAPGGLVVCQREQYVGLLTCTKKLKSLLESEEVKAGVSENAYLKQQYEYYFRASGFEVHFVPAAETMLQRILLPFNGWLFSKWVILATKGQHSGSRSERDVSAE